MPTLILPERDRTSSCCLAFLHQPNNLVDIFQIIEDGEVWLDVMLVAEIYRILHRLGCSGAGSFHTESSKQDIKSTNRQVLWWDPDNHHEPIDPSGYNYQYSALEGVDSGAP